MMIQTEGRCGYPEMPSIEYSMILTHYVVLCAKGWATTTSQC